MTLHPAGSQNAVAPILRLSHITKRFGALTANDDISLDLHKGEVLALLGENGAGKSTLVSILFGHYTADGGTVEAFGQPLPPGDTRAALAAGIGMVHQHFTLADNLSVLDNVMLGTEPLWRPVSRRSAARAALVETARRFGLTVDPDARVADLSVGERQRVEILKALVPFGRRRGARILILDEPTAVLTPQESESLFATLQQLVAEGLAVIFISHKLDEVLRVSDRVAVLRAGRLVATLPVRPGAAGAPSAMASALPPLAPAAAAAHAGPAHGPVPALEAATPLTKAALAELMVGRRVAPATRTPRARGAVVCALANASLRTGPRTALRGVNLRVHAGEVVAIAGVSGNGQQALADLLCGLHALDAGTLTIEDRVLPARPRAWVEAGIARVPEDRHAAGVVGDLPLWENAVLERYAQPVFSRCGLMRRSRAQAYARGLVERFDVRGTEAGGLETVARRLSGGNMQKLILGRALTAPAAGRAAGEAGGDAVPPFIIVNQPTWGLDIGAVAYVHQQLLDACARGAAVLVISEDLDEVFALADRIAVMHHGQLTEARPAAGWTLQQIGLAMTGQHEGAPHAGTEAAHV